jgi:peptidoglycan DL-endopeptidase CwlO
LLLHIRNISFVALASVVAVAALGAPAVADPISDKQAEARALQDQIEATNQEISALGERYNGAQLRLQEAEAALADVQARIDATEAEVNRINGLVDQRAASVYKRALTGRSLDGFSFDDARNLVTRRHYAANQAQRDNDLLHELAEAKEQLADQRATAEQARAAAAAERQTIIDTRASLETAVARQQELLGQVQGELAQLVQQELERRQREAEAVARQKLTGGDGDPNLAAPGPAAAAAIEWGKTQIGKTYVWAASGPDHYDCSGFTMAAFGQAGVELPHYSGAQYDMLPHVPLSAVLPGDLMFWGSGGSSHVAIYVGDAQVLESGGTGHDVHIGPIWGKPTGAARVL